jgi:hypothetical protein
MTRRALLAIAAVCVCAQLARAQDLRDRFNVKLFLTGLYLAEQGAGPPDTNEATSGISLGYFELRTILDARRLPGAFELHVDARARITPDDWNTANPDKGYVDGSQTIARGYFGGREYEVKQAYVRRRGARVDFALGRQYVAEADALKLDGARVWARFGKHWDVSGFAGAYPNPFSRSVTTDYYNGFAFAGGADSSYTYDKIWGAFSIVGAYLGGNDDGGPLPPTFATMNGTPAPARTETPRAYLTWQNFVRIVSWLDVYSDFVVDVAGAAGAQLTRADVLASARAGRFLTLRAGYDHLSSIAIEMYLTSLIANRAQFVANTIENNLIIARTARDEGRLQLDFTFATTSIYAEGRVRHRGLAQLEDPQFANNPQFPSLAFDATVGARDRGRLAGLRLGMWLSYLADYRGRSIIWDLDVGRSFWDEKLSIDIAFLYSRTRDAGAGLTCNPNQIALLSGVALNNNCWGARDGAEYEFGLTVSGSPWKKWLGLLDYRVVIDDAGTNRPNLLTHLLLLRIEARY